MHGEPAVPRALENAFFELVAARGVEAPALAALFSRHGVPDLEIAAILRFGPERLLSYRTRARATLEDVLRTALPRSTARLGARFASDFDDFLAEHAPRSEYLRDVVRGFIDSAAPGWRSAGEVPPFLEDLANHEALHFELGAAPDTRPGRAAPALRLDAPVSFIDASRVARYRHAVHEFPDDGVPDERDVALFVYRDAAHSIRYLELTPLAGEILFRLRTRGSAFGAAVLEACGASGVAPETVVPSVSELLSDLARRGALLGAEPAVPVDWEALSW